MKLGLGIICRNEEKVIERCLSSFKSIFDVIVVVDSGSTDSTLEIIKNKFPNVILIEVDFPKGFNFSLARNVYVKYLDKTCDWIYVCDCDDIADDSHLQAIKRLTHSPYHAISFRYNTGDTYHNHYRMFRTKKNIKYAGACHEYLCVDGPRYHSESQVYHRPADLQHYEDSMYRNYAILKQQYDSGDRSNRTLFYLANTLAEMQNYTEAVDIYLQYLENPCNYHDERQCAFWRCARWLAALGQVDESTALCLQALQEDTTVAEIYRQLAWNFRHDPTKASFYNQKADALPFRNRLFNEKSMYKM